MAGPVTESGAPEPEEPKEPRLDGTDEASQDGRATPVTSVSEIDDHPAEVPDDSAGGVRKRRGIRSLLPPPIWHIGRLLLLALIIEYLVVPQLAGPRKLVHLLSEVNPLLLLLGVALEAASLVCYSELTRVVLPGARRLSLPTLMRIQMTTLSVSHCTPGGSATGTALGYRLMTQAGAVPGDVGFALGMQGIGSAVLLNVILWIALIVSIPVWGFSGVYLSAAAVGALLLGAAGFLVFLLTRGQERAAVTLEKAAQRLPFVDGAALRRSFERFADRLEELGRQRPLVIRAVLWGLANWIFDAASLWVFVGAFGHWVNPDGLLVAYGLANVLAAIPITPGGLGVVEATLTSLLVGFGTPRGVAALGVIGWRLINFWAPIPLGGLTYLSLRVDSHAGNGHGHGRLTRIVHRIPLIRRIR